MAAASERRDSVNSPALHHLPRIPTLTSASPSLSASLTLYSVTLYARRLRSTPPAAALPPSANLLCLAHTFCHASRTRYRAATVIVTA